jgi:hypothetical protein
MSRRRHHREAARRCAAPPAPVALLVALAATAALALPPAASAAEISLATGPAGEPAAAVLRTISDLSGVRQLLGGDLELQLSTQPLHLQLQHASLAEQRQAVAFALGCWWARPSGAEEQVVYSRLPSLPQDDLQARWTSSGLIDQAEDEALVRGLMAPWLVGDAGLAYQRVDGSWPNTLDRAGHAHLVQILALLERPHACCPDLVPELELPDLRRPLAAPVAGGSWDGLARNLALAANICVALGPTLDPEGSAPEDLPAAPLAQVLAAIRAGGVQAAMVHGVLCIGLAGPEDAEHPAQRRQLAVVPIGHLIRNDREAAELTAGLRELVRPAAWRLPGWGLSYLRPAHALLAAADPAQLQRLLEALDTIDQLGLEDGLAQLGTSAR